MLEQAVMSAGYTDHAVRKSLAAHLELCVDLVQKRVARAERVSERVRLDTDKTPRDANSGR